MPSTSYVAVCAMEFVKHVGAVSLEAMVVKAIVAHELPAVSHCSMHCANVFPVNAVMLDVGGPSS